MALLIADPVDLLLDTETNDLVFVDGDLVFSTGYAAVAQGIRIALGMIRGEWFMDLAEGVPYYERDGVDRRTALLGQKFNRARAIALFRRTIAAVPGVAQISDIVVTFDTAIRKMTVRWEVITTFGDTIADSLEV